MQSFVYLGSWDLSTVQLIVTHGSFFFLFQLGTLNSSKQKTNRHKYKEYSM